MLKGFKAILRFFINEQWIDYIIEYFEGYENEDWIDYIIEHFAIVVKGFDTVLMRWTILEHVHMTEIKF